MKRIYACPQCDAVLNPSVKIVLRAHLKRRSGLLLFSPRPGNYDVFVPQGFPLESGDKVEFSCPVCGFDLTSPKGKTWAEIRFSTDTGHRGSVVFSKIYGTHATCFITQERARWFGEDAGGSTNFWGAGPGSER
jgi:hypothetical protein